MPSLLAVNALLLGSSSGALEKDLPEWIERVSTLLPAEAAFLTEAGRGVDPLSYSLLSEEPGAVPGPVPGRGGVPRPPAGHGALFGEGQALVAPRNAGMLAV